MRLEHCSTPERRAVSSAISTAGWRKFVQRRDRNPGPAGPRERSNSDRNRKRAISNRKSGAGDPPPVPAASALFFSKIAPYIGGAGSPAMEINDRRNKPFGPGGSTRRLHPSPPLWCGFRRGRTRIDEGVKGEFFLGMVPPLSGYAIVANDNYAPVAQAA